MRSATYGYGAVVGKHGVRTCSLAMATTTRPLLSKKEWPNIYCIYQIHSNILKYSTCG